MAADRSAAPALEVDLSDFSDEYVSGFLSGQEHALGRGCGGGGCRSVALYRVPTSELDTLRRQRPRRPEDVAS